MDTNLELWWNIKKNSFNDDQILRYILNFTDNNNLIKDGYLANTRKAKIIIKKFMENILKSS